MPSRTGANDVSHAYTDPVDRRVSLLFPIPRGRISGFRKRRISSLLLGLLQGAVFQADLDLARFAGLADRSSKCRANDLRGSGICRGAELPDHRNSCCTALRRSGQPTWPNAVKARSWAQSARKTPCAITHGSCNRAYIRGRRTGHSRLRRERVGHAPTQGPYAARLEICCRGRGWHQSRNVFRIFVHRPEWRAFWPLR